MDINATIERPERNETRTIVIIIFSDKNNSNLLTLPRHVMELAEHVTKDTADSDGSIFLQNLDDTLSHFAILISFLIVNILGEHFSRYEDNLRKDLQVRRQHAL
ncbi:hypothetical protein AVEN_179132-1 [Araneus ventricosus]|uniref:Uncharacterized protein n=1 Tax=Araneus ventricosus TaxID=182803 RepID=A0A4Y2EYG1_ARAVE|nr:hypothetical protein AVEN_179132-1 [Araneus ventricosus]